MGSSIHSRAPTNLADPGGVGGGWYRCMEGVAFERAPQVGIPRIWFRRIRKMVTPANTFSSVRKSCLSSSIQVLSYSTVSALSSVVHMIFCHYSSSKGTYMLNSKGIRVRET